jgi:hypothetical protein
VYTADPGTESYEKLQMLTVIGAQRMSSSWTAAASSRGTDTPGDESAP